MTEQNPLTQQVGGDHYRSLKIQPIEFSMANRLDPCSYSILKYLSRHEAKNGAQDVRKARHFQALRRLLAEPAHRITAWAIDMRTYCLANQLPARETAALYALAAYLETGSELHASYVETAIEMILTDRYGETVECS